MLAFVNGEFVPGQRAMINVTDLSIQRGYAIFDFFRTSNFVPLFLDDYLERFFKSAEGLRLHFSYDKAAMKEIIYKLIESNGAADTGIRMILTGGYSSDSYTISQANFIVIQQPLAMHEEQFQQGLRVILHEYGREFPKIKSTNYLAGIWLQQRLIDRQADEVLYHSNGRVLEFPRSNVFIITENNAVVTPGEQVLEGITRMKVLQLAKQRYDVQVKDVTIDELMTAKEVFLTSTTKRLLPVLEIEGQLIGNGQPGAITKELLTAFICLEKAYLKKHCIPRSSCSQ